MRPRIRFFYTNVIYSASLNFSQYIVYSNYLPFKNSFNIDHIILVLHKCIKKIIIKGGTIDHIGMNFFLMRGRILEKSLKRLVYYNPNPSVDIMIMHQSMYIPTHPTAGIGGEHQGVIRGFDNKACPR
jgi:hypothetical protein